jgi:hypothetical protein
MLTKRLLVAAMAAKCQAVIRRSNEEVSSLPRALHPKHLLWMCAQIIQYAQEWPAAKLFRWIGAIQSAILANHMLNIRQVRNMFGGMKRFRRVSSRDQDLVDHLDPNSSFKFDIGGQG